MHIAFFGYQGSFDYQNIGGTNSMMRRLSYEIIDRDNNQVDYVFYGAKYNFEISHHIKFCSKYYSDLTEALHQLKNYDHVIIVYFRPKDVIKIKKFIFEKKKIILFHVIYLDWQESILKQKIKYSLIKILEVNGISFAISYRLYNEVKKWEKNVKLLFPPVSEEFFIPLSERKIKDNIQVTFIGRIDTGKGIQSVIELFNRLKHCDNVELSFFGTYWDNDPTAVAIHNYLINQNDFNFISVPFKKWTPDTDLMVQSSLKKTDIFIQPYQKLSSTIDTPLLLLESMATLCPVITKPYGNIPDIYPSKTCLIDDKQILNTVETLVSSVDTWLPEEWELINIQNKKLNFNTSAITTTFIRSINDISGVDSS